MLQFRDSNQSFHPNKKPDHTVGQQGKEILPDCRHSYANWPQSDDEREWKIGKIPKPHLYVKYEGKV